MTEQNSKNDQSSQPRTTPSTPEPAQQTPPAAQAKPSKPVFPSNILLSEGAQRIENSSPNRTVVSEKKQ